MRLKNTGMRDLMEVRSGSREAGEDIRLCYSGTQKSCFVSIKIWASNLVPVLQTTSVQEPQRHSYDRRGADPRQVPITFALAYCSSLLAASIPLQYFCPPHPNLFSAQQPEWFSQKVRPRQSLQWPLISISVIPRGSEGAASCYLFDLTFFSSPPLIRPT